jgi:hypothetical protein
MRFEYTIFHVPGKDLTAADALSRAPMPSSNTSDELFSKELDAYVQVVMQHLPVSESCFHQIAKLQGEDEVCQRIRQYCLNGWPTRQQIESSISPYHTVAAELTIQQDLLMRGNRIVIPATMRREILDQIHVGHQGITKCRERTHQSVWWPGINRQLGDIILSCPECCKDRQPPTLPLKPSEYPKLPWETVGTDLFSWKESNYLLIVDYFSRFIEIARLPA